MLILTPEHIKWNLAIINEAKERTKNPTKQAGLDALYNQIDQIGQTLPNISIKERDIEETLTAMSELEGITNHYSKISDITDLNEYDDIKKKMTSRLQYLATYKDIFLNEVSYLEDYLKKELRVRLAHDIMENHTDVHNKKPSFTQADKLVEMDARYIAVKEQVRTVSKIATQVKTKYDFYMKFWQMVFQSVSTASKEKFAAKNNSD